MDEKTNGEEPAGPTMSEEMFAHHLNGLVSAALLGGVRFGDVVHTLEFAKSDVIEMMRDRARQEAIEQRPRIVLPGNIGLPPE